MKKLNHWLMMGLVCMTMGASACSGSEDEPAVPEFPTEKTMNINAESEQAFSFNANMDWKLSSNKSWCTLQSAEMSGQNISGKAGSQSVKVKVSDAGQDFEQAEATLTLTMGGESKPIATIIRAGKDYELKIMNSEGKEITTLAIGAEGTISFSVDANFTFGVKSLPDWIEWTAQGNDITASVKEGFLKNPNNATVTLANAEGTASFQIPVTYTGMDPKKIIIQSADIESGSFWGWNVSLDGKTFTKKNDLTDETEEVKDKMTFNITALNDAYQPVYIEEVNGEYYFDNVDWIHLNANGETATLTIDAADKTRNGIVMVFPKAVYDEIKGNLKNNIISEGQIKYEYEQNYFLISLTQKDANASSFTVKIKNVTLVECTPGAEEMYLEYLKSEFAVQESDIATISVPANTPLWITPGLTAEEWNGGDGSSIIAIIPGGAELDFQADLKGEGGLVQGDKEYFLQITTPANFTEPIVLVFKGTDGLNKKVLLIMPVQ